VIEQLLAAGRLLTMGLVDRAEGIYREVADQDPLNAIAVVGLARCALARGDDHAAYRLAARALAIDPEDDMARRMEARLAEVLAMRGEPVTRTEAAGGTGPAMRPVVTETDAAVSPADITVTGTDAAASPAEGSPTSTRRGLLDRLLGR
jgi:tetratricopeptide (TPR) repeat protein